MIQKACVAAMAQCRSSRFSFSISVVRFSVQQFGRLALVAAGPFERPPDQHVLEVATTSSFQLDAVVGKRRIRPVRRRAGICRISSGRSATPIWLRPGDSANVRSMTFSSWRTLPGQSNAISACCASCASVTRPRGGTASFAKPIEKVLREQRDVRAPLAQRRQPHGNDVQAVEQILAERALVDHASSGPSWSRR